MPNDTTAPALSTDVTLSEEERTAVTNLVEHATACGRLECGHTGRNADPQVRRALFLYQAADVVPDAVADTLPTEPTAVQVMYGELVRVGQRRPRYVRVTSRGGRTTYQLGAGEEFLPSAWMPDGHPFRVTEERATVYGATIRGESATTIADAYPSNRGKARSVETVKSHLGWLRRHTAAHDTTSALLALIAAGRFDLRGNLLTTDSDVMASLQQDAEAATPATGDDTATPVAASEGE